MRVFWSYAKRDDAKPAHVTQLRQKFEIILGQCIGDDVEIFQDTTGLQWGAKWREALKQNVENSDVFICILSPSYFNSKTCIQEVVWAIDAKVRIHPILYRSCPKGFKSNFSGSDAEAAKLNDVSLIILDHQYADFTSLRNLNKDSTEVMDFLDKIAEQIA